MRTILSTILAWICGAAPALTIMSCGLIAAVPAHAQYTFSYTYQNMSRIDGGGTLETGDTIEVRALMKVDRPVTNLFYRDTIASGLQLVPNSMKIVTNEGLLFRGTYSNAGNDDEGMVRVSGGITYLRINIGSGAANVTTGNFNNSSGGGSITPGVRPMFYGTTLFVVAYQLVITADFGDIVYPSGTFYYRDQHGVSKIEHFSYPGIRILPNEGLCQNFSSASFTAESDFGRGTLQNRVAGVAAPGYTKWNLTPNNPVDGQYSVANNTSGSGSTDNSIPYGSGSDRVFRVWDIVGDHTNATDPEAGNPPVAPGTEGGYMLVVNSAYPTGEAYSDVISGLCPNTYYEFSAWIRNICGYCGIDSNSVSTNKPGVRPNLAFTINDVDHYTTGEIPWTQKWVKRGFLYRTGPNETSFKITIKNNAAGGGGNDWVLDDIKLATCYPDLIMNPSEQVEVCAGGILNLRDTVRSYFDNYNHYCWEKSTDGGTTWLSTGNCGEKTPEFIGGMWEYVVDTAFVAALEDSGVYLRLKVATTPDNMNNGDCVVQDAQKLLLKIGSFECQIVGERFGDLRVTRTGHIRKLRWNMLDEAGVQSYEVQRSDDGVRFETVARIPPDAIANGQYEFGDAISDLASVFYRIKINDVLVKSPLFSRVVVSAGRQAGFTMRALSPFNDHPAIDMHFERQGIVELFLYDAHGRQLVREMRRVSSGHERILLQSASGLPAGIYVLKVVMNGVSDQRKILKR